MDKKLIKATLPAFAFVESSGHDGDELRGRTVILHIRSASVVEIFDEENFFSKEDIITLRFYNRNLLGEKEYYIAALHYCATLDENYDKKAIMEQIVIPAAHWYCDHCTWMDQNMITGDEYKNHHVE